MRMKALLNEVITWKNAERIPVPSSPDSKSRLKGCIFKNELSNKVGGMDYVLVLNWAII